MKKFSVLVSALAVLALTVSSCRTPPPSKFDRQQNGLKAAAGGFNPGRHHGKK